LIVETPTPSWTVYAHIAPNGKMYVGITGIKPWQRWGYGHSYKNTPRFYEDIQKYGWKNIQHEIVASGLTKEEAEHMEKLLIQKLDLTNVEKGYNTLVGKEGNPEIWQRQSQRVRAFYEKNGSYPSPNLGTGLLQTMEYKHNDKYVGGKEKSHGSVRRIKCLDTGIEYESVVDAANATGINVHHIYGNALGARVNAGGMQWEYMDAPHNNAHARSEKYRANKRGIKNGRAKPIRCIETGEIFMTCQDLAKKPGIQKSIITQFMKNNQRHLGLHYEYVNKGEITNGTCISESQTNPDEN